MQVKSREDSYRAPELMRDTLLQTPQDGRRKSCAREETSDCSKAPRWGQGEVPSLRMDGVEDEQRGGDRNQAGQQFSCLTLCSITGVSPFPSLHRDLQIPPPQTPCSPLDPAHPPSVHSPEQGALFADEDPEAGLLLDMWLPGVSASLPMVLGGCTVCGRKSEECLPSKV